MVQIRIDTEDGECRKDVYEAVGTFILKFILDETREAYGHGFEAGYKEGHKDGMTEAVTTITE